jgi:3-deoxy-D-manno-octulosonic-acid transferase
LPARPIAVAHPIVPEGIMLYALYRGLTDLADPLVPLLLDRRQAAGKEDPARRGERLGRPGAARPPGRLVWLHGASVGEALSAQALIRRLLERDPDGHVLLTTGTVTSAGMMAQRLPPRAVHQFVPVDRMAYVRRFLDHWQPDLVLWIESEIWPNLLTEIGRRGIPAAMINARMSERSFRRWRRTPGTIGRLLRVFRLVLPWDDGEAAKLAALGAPKIGPAGNLKFSSDPPGGDPAALEALRAAVGDRPLWLAASTHDGEEAVAAEAHRALAEVLPELLTVVVPRHPARGEAIAGAVRAAGLALARRSAGRLPEAGTPVYLADTMGEMGVFLRLAPIVFVGGSLVPHGGHNPIEAAQLGSAILYGPHMTNFPEIARELEAACASAMRRPCREP